MFTSGCVCLLRSMNTKMMYCWIHFLLNTNVHEHLFHFCSGYSQKRLVFFSIVLFHLQQPAVPSLPQEGGCIWVFPAVRAHVEFNVLCTDGATELCGKRPDKSSYTQLFLRIHPASFHSITRAVWVPFCVLQRLVLLYCGITPSPGSLTKTCTWGKGCLSQAFMLYYHYSYIV